MKRARINYMLYLVVGALLFGLVILCLNIFQLRSMQNDHLAMHMAGSEVEAMGEKIGINGRRPVVWVAGKNVSTVHQFSACENWFGNYQDNRHPVCNFNLHAETQLLSAPLFCVACFWLMLLKFSVFIFRFK